MRDNPGAVRLWITAGLLLSAFALLQTMSHGEAMIPRQPLNDLPNLLGPWSAEKESPLDDQILQVLGVSDYTNRIYFQPGQAAVQLYVGYYSSQRTGDTIHSPKNCLPGAGWDPIQFGYATVSVSGGRKIVVNEDVIQKDQVKQLVFYWYQGRGRVIASEYAGKFWMVADAISRNRTDGALVRVITPMNDGADKARARLLSFTQILFPSLDRFIPN
jgi:EpsI family protein